MYLLYGNLARSKYSLIVNVVHLSQKYCLSMIFEKRVLFNQINRANLDCLS